MSVDVVEGQGDYNTDKRRDGPLPLRVYGPRTGIVAMWVDDLVI